MSTKPKNVFGSHIRIKTLRPFGEKPPEDRPPVAVGVPLTQLIRRNLVVTPDVVLLHNPRSMSAERFRRLRTMLGNVSDPQVQVLVISSAAPGDGKTTIALNLALAFAADKNERVLLVDADLRRPSISARLVPSPQLGLAEVILGQAPLEHAIVQLENSSLEVLPATAEVEDPLDLIASDSAGQLVSTLRERYRTVIIDTPPVVAFTDADALGAHADGILLVARANVTLCAKYQQAVESITSGRILGTVLNESHFSFADWHRYGADDYPSYYEKSRTERQRDEEA